MKKHFCYELYKNLAIWSDNSQLTYAPCSYFRGPTFAPSTQFDLKDVWNHSQRKIYKIAAENDLPIAGCEVCYNNESAGLKSRRQGSFDLYESFLKAADLDDSQGPIAIDYSIGNLCNLKCIICMPESSTTWIPDHIKLYNKTDQSKYKKYNQLEIVDTSLLQNLKYIHFHGGGEPLMSDHHKNLLLQIKSVKGLSDVRVSYNTNATFKVSKEVLDLWEECQLIELYFSIDDIGNRFEYQRTNAKWQQVLDTLEWFRANMPVNHLFYISCTYSYLNILYLDELIEWKNRYFSKNRLDDSVQIMFEKVERKCTIDAISPKFFDILQQKFSGIDELIAISNRFNVIENYVPMEFIKYIEDLDKIRNTNWHKILPELASALN
jgi:hypothetical protein